MYALLQTVKTPAFFVACVPRPTSVFHSVCSFYIFTSAEAKTTYHHVRKGSIHMKSKHEKTVSQYRYIGKQPERNFNFYVLDSSYTLQQKAIKVNIRLTSSYKLHTLYNLFTRISLWRFDNFPFYIHSFSLIANRTSASLEKTKVL